MAALGALGDLLAVAAELGNSIGAPLAADSSTMLADVGAATVLAAAADGGKEIRDAAARASAFAAKL